MNFKLSTLFSQSQPGRFSLRLGVLLGLAMTMVLAGCNLPVSASTPDADLVSTLAYQTLVARDAQQASATPLPAGPTAVKPTAAPQATQTQVPPTAVPTNTPLSSVGLRLNASKSESMLEREAFCFLLFSRIEIGLRPQNHKRVRLATGRKRSCRDSPNYNFQY